MMKLTYKRKIRIQTKERQASPAGKPATDALVETVLRASKVSLTAGASTPSCDSGSPPHQVIKLSRAKNSRAES